MQRRSVHFSGRVQGVGFRATTQQLARRLGLSGWVKNLTDGRVEAAVQGPAGDVDRLLRDLREHFGQGIKDIESRQIEPQPESDGFQIKY